MISKLTKQQLIATLSFVIVMVISLITIFLFGNDGVVLAKEEYDPLSVTVDGKDWEKSVAIEEDDTKITFKSSQETWVKIPYSSRMYVTHQVTKNKEYGLSFLSEKDFSIEDEVKASAKRNKTGKSDSNITTQVFESTADKKRVVYLRLVPDKAVTLTVYRQSKKVTEVSFDELMGEKVTGELFSFKKNNQFVLKEAMVFPTEEEANKEGANKEEANKEEANKEEANKEEANKKMLVLMS